MEVAVLGFAGQGRAAFDYWSAKGDNVTIFDRDAALEVPRLDSREAPPSPGQLISADSGLSSLDVAKATSPSVKPLSARADLPWERAISRKSSNGVKHRLGEDYLSDLDGFDLLVRTPALHPDDILKANPSHPDILQKVTTVTNEFFRVCPSRNIIGVTGTKGKGTTSTLIAKMLEAAGFRVHLGGNIGIPPLDLLKDDIQPDDWVVMELANYQLIDIKYSPHIAVCLMMAAEHLDWHKDINEYVETKQQLFRWQKPDDIAIHYGEDKLSEKVAGVSRGKHLAYFSESGARVVDGAINIGGQTICRTDELKLLGKHNWQNVCAAVTTVWQVTQDTEAMRRVLTTFSGLEYRLELTRELDGVRYYNDSFGTTPETAIVAIEAFQEPKVIILGGSSKNSDYHNLARTIAKANIRKIILIGNPTVPEHPCATPEIEAALHKHVITNIESLVRPGGMPMENIVAKARGAAQPGDVVVFSTACASFDMFKNYKDRGEQFRQAVQALV